MPSPPEVFPKHPLRMISGFLFVSCKLSFSTCQFLSIFQLDDLILTSLSPLLDCQIIIKAEILSDLSNIPNILNSSI